MKARQSKRATKICKLLSEHAEVRAEEEKMRTELVYHPNHYNKEGRKECWDEMIDIFGPEAVAIFDTLSAYKYLYRAGLKDGNPTEQDMEKIKNYMNHANKLRDIEELRGNDVVNNCYWDMKSLLEEMKELLD